MTSQKGQALIEAVLALSLAAITVSVVVFLVVSSLANSTYTKEQSLASQYARQGLDVVRNIRDQDYSGFGNAAGTYCLPDPPPSALPSRSASCTTANVANIFIRQIDIFTSAVCGQGMLITSKVSWSDSKCANNSYCHNVNLRTCLAIDNSL